MLFVDLILATHRSLKDAGIDHAFGGALALMHYVKEPRTTWDIDVNISIRQDDAQKVVDALSGLIEATPAQVEMLKRDGQVRLIVGRYPIDIFLAVHEFHDEMQTMSAMRPFGKVELPYISATHLAVLKALFDRPKDWIDIMEMMKHKSVDVQRAIGWLASMTSERDERTARFRAFSLARPDERSRESMSFFELLGGNDPA